MSIPGTRRGGRRLKPRPLVVMPVTAGWLVLLLTTFSVGPGCRREPSSKPTAQTTSFPASRPLTTQSFTPPTFSTRQSDRDAMVRVIRAYGMTDPAVLAAMRSVPRHEFVPKRLSYKAYADSPLPIGYGQTISQPFVVAEMTRLLAPKDNSHVLEIGTGSGYQAAVLTHFTPNVYTIEIIKQLADPAAQRLKRLGYTTVHVHHGDGYYGWPEAAPFDRIIVTCAAGQIPPPLIKQLAPGGRMVIPVGAPFSQQSLMLVTKDEKGTVRTQSLMAVRFVPFVDPEGAAR